MLGSNLIYVNDRVGSLQYGKIRYAKWARCSLYNLYNDFKMILGEIYGFHIDLVG